MLKFKISKSKLKTKETKRLFNKKHNKELVANKDKFNKALTRLSIPKQSDKKKNYYFLKD
jgi:DNA polymerase III sliding clamp (beta) subunit (PCNA family)